MDMNAALQRLQEELEPLERLVRLFSASLDQPKLVATGDGRSYRYEHPNIHHFCLLKAAVALTTLNAAIELARLGYIFQVNALIRVVVECNTHLEFVVDPSRDAEHVGRVERYIKAYFADYDRDPSAPFQKPPIKQGTVNATIGKTLDEIAAQFEELEGRKPAAEAYFSIYRAFSNFIHARYPESIDLYGNRPGYFHTHGMSGTRKDEEMIATLEPVIGTTSNVFGHMVSALKQHGLISSDPVVAAWHRDRVNF